MAAGDTVRWIVGDTSSGSGADLRVNVLVEADPLGPEDQSGHHHQPPDVPAGTDLDRQDVDGVGVLGLPEGPDAGLAAPGAGGQRRRAGRCAACRWRTSAFATRSAAAIRRGSRCAPSMTARRSISSSRAGIAQGELPPLFVIGAQGDGQLVNYRFRSPYYIVDRLFGAAELRLGGDRATWCGSSARMAWRGGD